MDVELLGVGEEAEDEFFVEVGFHVPEAPEGAVSSRGPCWPGGAFEVAGSGRA